MTTKALSELSSLLQARCEPYLLTPTRIQFLPQFVSDTARVWVKREDESGFACSGTKKRKCASLLHALKVSQPSVVGLIGGAYSNHLPALLPLLYEAGIPARLFLKQSHHQTLQGNRFLLHLLTLPEQITWVAASDWPQVESLARHVLPPDGWLIPEGGNCPASLAGACTLMLDILRNEAELGLAFDHIVIDSGSGLTAGALSLMLDRLGRASALHVVLMADDQAYLYEKITEYLSWAQADLNWPTSMSPPQPATYMPVTAKAFGSVNATVRHEIEWLARRYGLLTDPIYTAKLFLTARHIIDQQALKGHILLVHSGGGTGLMGFAQSWPASSQVQDRETP